MLAGAIVYLAYYPSDSVAVEQGDALWFTLLAVLTATVTWSGWFWQHAGRALSEPEQCDPEQCDPEQRDEVHEDLSLIHI